MLEESTMQHNSPQARQIITNRWNWLNRVVFIALYVLAIISLPINSSFDFLSLGAALEILGLSVVVITAIYIYCDLYYGNFKPGHYINPELDKVATFFNAIAIGCVVFSICCTILIDHPNMLWLHGLSITLAAATGMFVSFIYSQINENPEAIPSENERPEENAAVRAEVQRFKLRFEHTFAKVDFPLFVAILIIFLSMVIDINCRSIPDKQVSQYVKYYQGILGGGVGCSALIANVVYILELYGSRSTIE